MDLNKPRIINKYAYKTGNPKSNNDILYDTQSHPEKSLASLATPKRAFPVLPSLKERLWVHGETPRAGWSALESASSRAGVDVLDVNSS